MSTWLLLALGVAGGAYSIYLGYHFYRHRERRRADRRGASRTGTPDSDRRAGRDRREPIGRE